MSWWARWRRRPATDAGAAARKHRERVAAQQPQVDEAVTRLARRGNANHFREAFEQALSPRRDE